MIDNDIAAEKEDPISPKARHIRNIKNEIKMHIEQNERLLAERAALVQDLKVFLAMLPTELTLEQELALTHLIRF